MCNLPFAKSRSRPDRSQRKAKLHKRIVFTNYAVPTSALDVASQDMTIETLLALRKKTDLSILLVTHNMEVARRLADEIGVMYQGRIIESGLPEEIWNDPKEDYTKKLIAAIPQPVKLVLDEG